MIRNIKNQRNVLIHERSTSSDIMLRIDLQKNKQLQLENNRRKLLGSLENIDETIKKILYLIDESSKEISELEKIIFVHNKTKLFSPNTCPYCLREVNREEGKCVCGCSIEEEQYEKFFYNDKEYISIIRVKKKSLESLKKLLKNKSQTKETIKQQIKKVEQSIKRSRFLVGEMTKDIDSNYNSALIRELDAKERILKEKFSKLKQAKELATKREGLDEKLSSLRKNVNDLDLKVKGYLLDAETDMKIKKR